MASHLDIVFPLFPQVTQLDFTGPHQFLSALPGARVIAASMGGAPITAHDGLVFSELAALETIPGCDVLCVPGGGGCTDAMQDPAYMAQIQRLAGTARYVTSVCTGSLILAAAGLLRGKRATSHWAWREMLPLFGAIPVAGRVVRDGNVFTGGGVTAGIDFALTLATELVGAEVAQAIQLGLEYAPAPPFNSGSPETAPAEVLALAHARMAASMPARRAAVERVAAGG
jgi:putative intracellular protease/amidase